MNAWQAALLGTVEGLTEFLPVSSTGHLVLLGDRLGVHDEAAKAFDVVIQLGAVLAVLLHYRLRLARLIAGVWSRDPASLRLLAALAIAFFPSALAGLAFHRLIKAKLFGPTPVALALLGGGLVMLGVQRWRGGEQPGDKELEELTPRGALAIGLAQCFALWPGMSRSMTTIVGGRLAGLGTRAAAEFSFLLAIPTLGAATCFDLLKSGEVLLAAPGSVAPLVVGMVTSFAVAWAVVALFLGLLSKVGLAPFAYYRLALGLAVLWFGTSG